MSPKLKLTSTGTCTGEKIADNTTYKQLGAELDASALADLKQKVEAAGYACR
jgi:hypothetical protein